jgi:hypothetical protein
MNLRKDDGLKVKDKNRLTRKTRLTTEQIYEIFRKVAETSTDKILIDTLQENRYFQIKKRG